MPERIESFRARVVGREPIVGTFLKTPSPIVCEVLGHTGFDAFCLDLEHAPFGRLDTDLCIAAFRAAHRPCLVRVADHSTTGIRNALDSGATGIVVPHVTTAEEASAIVKAAHFGDGGRGYAGSTRAAGYTTKSMSSHLADSHAQTTIIVQIEDLAALHNVADIAAVDGVDAVFIGRIDLAVAMGKSPADPAVVEAVRRICADASGTCVGMFTPNLGEIPDWRDAGASLFLLSSDHNLMLAGAAAMLSEIRGHLGP